jgi:integrase
VQATILWRRWMNEHPSGGTSSASLDELFQAYLDWAAGFYPHAESSESNNLLYALESLAKWHPGMSSGELRPAHVKAWLDHMDATGLACTTIASRLQRLKRCLRWAVSEEMIPPGVWHAIQAVSAARKGRKPDPITPISFLDVACTLPYLNAPCRAMIRLQLLTGARPSEITGLANGYLDASMTPWVAQLHEHKTEYLGRGRRLYFGPDARAILEPWLCDGDPIFRNANGKAFSTRTYRQAIWRGCDARAAFLGIKGKSRLALRWSPNQLRHTRLTELERFAGLDASRAVAGHAKLETTQQHYIARDDHLARETMERAG